MLQGIKMSASVIKISARFSEVLVMLITALTNFAGLF